MRNFLSKMWGIPEELYKPIPRKGHFLLWGAVWLVTGVGMMLASVFLTSNVVFAQIAFVLGLLVTVFMGMAGLCMYSCHSLIEESRYNERMRLREDHIPWH